MDRPPEDDESLPGPVNPAAISEELGIMRYVEKETPAEQVLALKKVHTERVFDAPLVVWSVQTDKAQYWVITPPPGLYAQAQFPSFDYALTFHAGLAYRGASSQRAETTEQQQDQLAVPWRRWEQAALALASAQAPEEYQAVGILCRACLLAMVKMIASSEMRPASADQPKPADFVVRAARVAVWLAPEPDAAALRAYLVAVASAAWQLVDWLAHAPNPDRHDADQAIAAVESVLLAFGAALVRRNKGMEEE
jgi:hypothetical protein